MTLQRRALRRQQQQQQQQHENDATPLTFYIITMYGRYLWGWNPSNIAHWGVIWSSINKISLFRPTGSVWIVYSLYNFCAINVKKWSELTSCSTFLPFPPFRRLTCAVSRAFSVAQFENEASIGKRVYLAVLSVSTPGTRVLLDLGSGSSEQATV